MEPLLIYDTTLRDGTQGENISFSASEKLSIAQRLDDFGIDYIEGGWPGSNPRDIQFFEMARRITFKHARISAFGATRRPNVPVAQDANLQALLAADTPVVTIFGKSWDLHVQKIMNNTLEENLAMIADSVVWLKAQGREVIYDAEHFFDGYADNPQYALDTLQAALTAGADRLVLCDTNGGTLPSRILTDMQQVQAFLTPLLPPSQPLHLGIHTHNDCGLAVANSLAAVEAGATLIQGTINGYGERCGNADLTTILPIITFKMKRPCHAAAQLPRLTALSRFVSETANMIPLNSRPFVGASAFAHKGGVHVAAISHLPRAYEHIEPEQVGNRRHVLVSDLAGKSNIEYKARELGLELGGNGFDSSRIVAEIKRLEQEGYQFDSADGSLKILIQKFTEQFRPLFELESFRVTIEKDKDSPCQSHATIKVGVDRQQEITAAEGFGPVSSLDNALRKALGKFFPGLHQMRLVDFKVRVIDGREGTAARVRVAIETRDQDEVWNTIGVSHDVIEASWHALADSFQYKLAKEYQKQMALHTASLQKP